MPEIAEVARIVHFLKKYAVGRTISKVVANEDTIVFKDTTHSAFIKAMQGKKVVDARQQGKYFWLVMDSSPHPLMHFGMTGWIVFRKDPEAHYRADAEGDEAKPPPVWPPKFMKFMLETDDEENDIAFIDPRRLGRIRLIDEPTGDIRKLSPLKENGPDPVVDGFELEWFRESLLKRKVPVKALLLDQAFISGVGNWVGDEILYHARIHPEQYSNTLTEAQQKQLYESTMYVCKTAVGVNGESAKFPKDWIFLYRWGKSKRGSKEKSNFTLPNGESLDFVKVGGRTSAYVKTRQKPTGNTAIEAGDKSEKGGAKGSKPAKRKKIAKNEEDDDEEVEEEREEEEEEEKVLSKRGTKGVKKAKIEIKEENVAQVPKKGTTAISKPKVEDTEEEEKPSKPKGKQISKQTKVKDEDAKLVEETKPQKEKKVTAKAKEAATGSAASKKTSQPEKAVVNGKVDASESMGVRRSTRSRK